MILHILKKDVRRVWPAIAAGLIVLAALARQDRLRSDAIPGQTEGYLNLLMPVVWAVLLGLAVEQEPLAGDRQFWLTRPYRRSVLLGAKLLFAALFVHAPSFLADCYILAARGFSPVAYAPQLIAKQLLLACALTLPSMALASVVRNFSHFVLGLLAIVAALLLLTTAYWGFNYSLEPFETTRRQLVLLLTAGPSLAILAMEYFDRRVTASRVVGAAAVLSIALLFWWFGPQSAFAMRATLTPSPAAPFIRLAEARGNVIPRPGGEVTLAIPVEVGGFPEGTRVVLDSLHSEISGAGAEHPRYDMPATPPHGPDAYQAWFVQYNGWDQAAPRWLTVNINPKTYAAMQNAPATITGTAGVRVIRVGQPVWMNLEETREIPGVGRCATQTVEDRIGRDRIKLECESPRDNPAATRVRLWSPDIGRDWKHALGDSGPFWNGPRLTWLSPLHRSQVSFDIMPDTGGEGINWQVPRSLIPTARIEVTPQTVEGYASVTYEFRDLDLRKYVVRRPIPAAAR